MKARPVFVVCPPRSGSTFVVNLLDSHPRIAMTVEAAWITFLRKAFLLASTPAGRWADDGENLRTPGILPERYTRAVAESFLATMQPFLDGLFGRVKQAEAAEWYGDKILSLRDLAFAIEWFPDAVFVQLVRDPRDMIASTYSFQEKQPAAWQGASLEQRIEHMAEFLGTARTMLEGRPNLLVRYEDLVADVVGGAGRMFEFLGLAVTDDVRRYLDGAARDLFASHGTSSSPQASIGRWRRDLPPEHQQQIDARLGELLAEFGYAR